MSTTTKKTAAKKTAAKKTTASRRQEVIDNADLPDDVDLPSSVADAVAQEKAERDARIERFEVELQELEESIVQREWLLVTRALDHSRADIMADGSLKLLALGWIKEKRAHGGADWDKLLDMTDKELLELHGISVEDQDAIDAEAAQAAKDAARS